MNVLLALGLGAFVQVAATAWVLSVDRGRAASSLALAMTLAALQVEGASAGLRGTRAIGFVAGCGLGSLAVSWWASRRTEEAFRGRARVLVPERRRNTRRSS